MSFIPNGEQMIVSEANQISHLRKLQGRKRHFGNEDSLLGCVLVLASFFVKTRLHTFGPPLTYLVLVGPSLRFLAVLDYVVRMKQFIPFWESKVCSLGRYRHRKIRVRRFDGPPSCFRLCSIEDGNCSLKWKTEFKTLVFHVHILQSF